MSKLICKISSNHNLKTSPNTDYDSSSSSFETYTSPAHDRESNKNSTPQTTLCGCGVSIGTNSDIRSQETILAEDRLNESTDYCFTETDDESAKIGAEYPWSASSDDSFANLSEHEVFEKLKERLYGNNTQITPTSVPYEEESENEQEIVEKKQEKKKISATIDPLWIDPKTGKFMSFIVKPSPNVSDDYAVDYVSEYEEEEEYGGDEEEGEDDHYSCHKLQRLSFNPVQSMTEEAVYEFEGCNISD